MVELVRSPARHDLALGWAEKLEAAHKGVHLTNGLVALALMVENLEERAATFTVSSTVDAGAPVLTRE